jgi:hypothetical protein
MAQVGDGLEQRRDDEVDRGVLLQQAVQQAGLLLQQQHLQQVGHVLGVRDDVVADGVAAVAAAALGGGVEDGQFETVRSE